MLRLSCRVAARKSVKLHFTVCPYAGKSKLYIAHHFLGNFKYDILNPARIMPRATQLLRRVRKAIKDLDLLRILESELKHELSSMRYQDEKVGTFGDFSVEWDHPRSQDVILRKKCSSGEEVAVSALLGHDAFQGDSRLPNEAFMKVCIKKPGLSSILLFDCVASSRGGGEVALAIQKTHCMSSSSYLDSSIYRGPLFSDLDPSLQGELRQYLATRGIEENFTSSLLLHLHRKEQAQYMAWLQMLKDMMIDEHQ